MTVGARAGTRRIRESGETEAAKKRRCSPSWARLIAKVYQADPLTCRECGGPLRIIAYLHDRAAIRKILDHLGLSSPEAERPPPEVRYVPLNDEGREMTPTPWVAEGP
jgi:hypothetical protein